MSNNQINLEMYIVQQGALETMKDFKWHNVFCKEEKQQIREEQNRSTAVMILFGSLVSKNHNHHLHHLFSPSSPPSPSTTINYHLFSPPLPTLRQSPPPPSTTTNYHLFSPPLPTMRGRPVSGTLIFCPSCIVLYCIVLYCIVFDAQ